MIKYNNFQPEKLSPTRHSVPGKLAVAAKRGQIVNYKFGSADEFELSTGKAGFFLRRDVVSASDLATLVDADRLRPNKAGFELPEKIDGVVQAEDILTVWVEGADYLDASMDNTVGENAPVTTAAGKFAKLTNSETQECMAVVKQNVAAKNGAGRRFLLEVRRAPKNIPAP